MARGGNKIELPLVDTQADFVAALRGTGSATTEVSTDPRVFERITLGLYREPSAAIRELVSNAYDADATRVIINTRAPEFDHIVVEDDGIGMSPSAIEQIVHHVGGSLKRSALGKDAGVTARSGFSPSGRKLIGQMGIGIYSVARLTRRFTIETKRKNDPTAIRLEIDLSGLNANNLPSGEESERYVAGYARVITSQVTDRDEITKSFTRIRLYDILPEARDILQSKDKWENYYLKPAVYRRGDMRFHLGRVKPYMPPHLPWEKSDPADRKFIKLVNALSTKDEASQTSASLDQTLDYYLEMLWRISLSAPLQYVEHHPFELTNENGVDFYSLDGNHTPERITVPAGVSIGKHLGVHALGANPTRFQVLIDDIELRRPVLFRGFTEDRRKIVAKPKMFIGKLDSEVDGSRLNCTAYFFWSYETKPKENNGILVRIAGASGTLFDPVFLDFRTSENLRLRQVSSEVFTENGLEAALNVDRESFVDSDADFKALQRWVHRSMTRLFTRLKYDQKLGSVERREAEDLAFADKKIRDAEQDWREKRGANAQPPRIVISTRRERPLNISDDAIFIGGISGDKKGGIEKQPVAAARVRAIVLVLDAWGLLDNLNASERTQLVKELTKATSFD